MAPHLHRGLLEKPPVLGQHGSPGTTVEYVETTDAQEALDRVCAMVLSAGRRHRQKMKEVVAADATPPDPPPRNGARREGCGGQLAADWEARRGAGGRLWGDRRGLPSLSTGNVNAGAILTPGGTRVAPAASPRQRAAEGPVPVRFHLGTAERPDVACHGTPLLLWLISLAHQ